MEKFSLDGISTLDEFRYAIDFLSRCNGTLMCGCDISDVDVHTLRSLYRNCCTFVACCQAEFMFPELSALTPSVDMSALSPSGNGKQN